MGGPWRDPVARFRSFWSKIAKSDGCWLWSGYFTSRGYGTFKAAGQSFAAHRFSYETFVGPIPDGLLVRHTCDVRACVRPEHLLVGTDADNSHDAVSRGRLKNPRADQYRERTACKNGHPFNEENTHYTKEGWRECRACDRATHRRAYDERGAEIRARNNCARAALKP